MNELTKTIVIIACAVIGAVYAVKGSIRLTKKDVKDTKAEAKAETITEAKSNTILETKLDYAIKGIDDIKLDNRDQGRQINVINERMARVEESTKSAHKRLDEIEK